MDPVGVRQHVPTHQSKDNEHNHSSHHPHYTHFGFFSVLLILVCRGFLFFALDHCSSPLTWHRCNIAGNLIVPAYGSLTEQLAACKIGRIPACEPATTHLSRRRNGPNRGADSAWASRGYSSSRRRSRRRPGESLLIVSLTAFDPTRTSNRSRQRLLDCN